MIPEIPWSIDEVVNQIHEEIETKKKQRFSIVVVAEGVDVPKEAKFDVSGNYHFVNIFSPLSLIS